MQNSLHLISFSITQESFSEQCDLRWRNEISHFSCLIVACLHGKNEIMEYIHRKMFDKNIAKVYASSSCVKWVNSKVLSVSSSENAHIVIDHDLNLNLIYGVYDIFPYLRVYFIKSSNALLMIQKKNRWTFFMTRCFRYYCELRYIIL